MGEDDRVDIAGRDSGFREALEHLASVRPHMHAAASVDQQPPGAGLDQIRVEHRVQKVAAER